MSYRAGWSLVLVCALARVAAADAPSWCKGKSDKVSSAGYWDSSTKDDPTDAVPAIVSCLCDKECGSSSSDYADHNAAVEEARKKWSARLEMSDDDWADAAEWSTVMPSTRQGNEVRNDKSNIAWTTLDPVGQFMLLNWDIANNYDANYIADALGPKLSEAGRLAYVQHCLGSNERQVQWAMCQPDIAMFDPKKIAAELHADKDHSGYQRFMVRLTMDRIREKLTKHAADVKEARGSDPAYDKMFAIADKTRKDWDEIWRTSAALVELAAAMDDARVTNSRRATQGCDDKTWPAFKEAVGSIPAKQFAALNMDIMSWKASPREQALQIVVANPKGYLAGVAHFSCHMNDPKKDPLVRGLGESLHWYPGFRGPRTATQVAIASAALELDDRSAHIEYPGVARNWFSADGGSSGGGNGVIATMKPAGDKVTITFQTVKRKEPRCVKYAYTHRLTGIDSNGRFIYESGCAKEEMVAVDVTSSPVTVKKQYAVGLKPGMRIWATEDLVDLAWPRPASSTPGFVAGAPVK